MDSGIKNVKQNIAKIYARKKIAIIGLCYKYADMALKRFQEKQPSGPLNKGEFWTNQTGIARDEVFANVYAEKDFVGFFLAHTEEYGVYLELANNRQNEALRPTVMAFYSRFERDLKAILE